MSGERRRFVARWTAWTRILAVALVLGGAGAPAAAQDPAAPAAPPAEKQAEKQVEKKTEPAPPAPTLSSLVPKASELRQRLADLRRSLSQGFDPAAARRHLQTLRDQADALARRVDVLRTSRAYGYDQLAELKASVRATVDALTQVTDGVSAALTRVDGLRQQWLAEKDRWSHWREAVPEDVPVDAVKPTVDEARQTIEQAVAATARAVEPLLAVQREAAAVQSRVQGIGAEVDGLLQGVRGDIFRKSALSLFASGFYAQFDGHLWRDLRANLDTVAWPDRAFFAAYGWVLALQILLSVGIAAGVLRSLRIVEVTPQWVFLRRRPLAASLFVGFAVPSLLYGPGPATWSFFLWAMVGVAAARLLAGLIERAWKRRILYLLVTLFLATQLFRVLGVPLPLFRVYVVLVALGGAPLCLWRARVNARRGDSRLYVWALRTGGGVLAVVLAAQAAGYSALSAHLLEASIESTFLVLLAWMLALLFRGAVSFLLGDALLGRYPPVHRVAATVVPRSAFLIDALVAGAAVAVLLEVWRVYDTPLEALAQLLSLGFSVGEARVSVGLALAALAIFYGAYVTSLTLQAVLIEHIYPRRHVEPGVRISMNRLVHYALVLAGFLAAVSFLGLDLRNLTILAGAFGIGIGFGLQNIVNNFVSGLILLFERPIKVGDMVQVVGEWGHIRKLGLRATVVQTLDRSELIVPNSDLISSPVTNWTFSDRYSRLILPVGVAYGSDVPLTMRLLKEIAEEHPAVLDEPKSQVFFMEFGDSALLFELRVWIPDIEERFRIRSDLNQEIDRRFREAAVEIAFPQRDLHLRTVDDRARRALLAVAKGRPEPGGGGADAEEETP